MTEVKEKNIVPPDMDYRYFEDYGSYKFKYKSKKFEIKIGDVKKAISLS